MSKIYTLRGTNNNCTKYVLLFLKDYTITCNAILVDIILCFKLKDAIKYARTELGAVAYYSLTPK